MNMSASTEVNIEHIYILVRSKRGQGVDDRVKQLCASPLFNTIRRVNPAFEKKIIPIQGDILEPNFGISSADEYTLIEQCHIVFHSAATIRFHEPLRSAIQMNINSVKKLLSLCHKMKNLQAIIHVSTAYANCNRSDCAEVIDLPSIQPKKLLDASEWMDSSVFDVLTTKLIRDRPNTYTYTKALAEFVISEEGIDLPIAIIRPSIVGASWKEPFPGWIDNYNGPSGLIISLGKGMLRTMLGNSNARADIVPVDIVANMMISVAWYTAVKRFDLAEMNWASYWQDYNIGIKKYVLREDFDHIPKYIHHCRRLKRIQNILLFSLVTLALKLVFYKSFRIRQILISMLRITLTLLNTLAYKLHVRK
ncbi:unnamed protein product [Didymodactylos carnosus]|uniref:Fatty acyl-CoA reductase n=1 Tax=Didymodactylos carnosus TaxID=1234261 RepID=A0A814P5D1_9BILA|nr:unnamed protein product [Didymodactylos carnosus]CAF3867567.1 unnamed protein product [Didymodactylos carnosus]